eukprot:Skav201564  [mRNA]  locus=scaffold152:33653:35000:- [translate_table: standard]
MPDFMLSMGSWRSTPPSADPLKSMALIFPWNNCHIFKACIFTDPNFVPRHRHRECHVFTSWNPKLMSSALDALAMHAPPAPSVPQGQLAPDLDSDGEQLLQDLPKEPQRQKVS